MSSLSPSQIFKYLDTENKSKIKKEKLKEALRYLGIIKTASEIEFSIKDLNDELDYDSFENFVENSRKTCIKKEQLLDAFKVFDVKNEGKCKASELIHALKSIGEKLNEEEIDDFKNKAQIDGGVNIEYNSLIDLLMD